MTKKDLFLLVLPAAAFIFIAICALWLSEAAISNFQHRRPSEEYYQQVLELAKGGKFERSTEQSLKIIGLELEANYRERESASHLARSTRLIAWSTLVTAVCQMVLVLSVGARCRKL
jgi:CHASE3 domain sensor protein